jgi:UDPglucose 6-dehydrogenase
MVYNRNRREAMNVSVIGTGYVGLVVGACLADTGHVITCVDNDESKVDRLNNGEIPIYEPGLEELVRLNRKGERLFFSTDLEKAVQESLINFIAVGTPQDEDGSADLSSVLAVASAIGRAIEGCDGDNRYKIVVNKSTVPVGTARKVGDAIRAETSNPFDVVSNPEFLKEGAAVNDFMNPDRVVVGVDDPRVAELMKELYSPFVRTGNPIMVMDIASAEMTKYAANTMLAVRISFMNEIANLCERVGADADLVRRGIGSDKRIGSSFLFPGIGYGGSCFPKDVVALVRTGQDYDYNMRIVEAAHQVNDRQKTVLLDKIVARYGDDLTGRRFAVWGLAFKPRTDDMREAPAVEIIRGLVERGAEVCAHDPAAHDEARHILGTDFCLMEHRYEVLDKSDALIICTEWNEFREPDFTELLSRMKEPVIFDGRNLYDPLVMKKRGLEYHCIGRAAGV